MEDLSSREYLAQDLPSSTSLLPSLLGHTNKGLTETVAEMTYWCVGEVYKERAGAKGQDCLFEVF